jgi:hypothetical protein
MHFFDLASNDKHPDSRCRRATDDVERIRAHFGVRQLGLGHDPWRSRVRHVDAGEILGRGFVREPQDAAAVARELHRHAFTNAAETLQLVMGKKAHVQRERLIGT